MKYREVKCKVCGIYKVLHDKMNHDFVESSEYSNTSLMKISDDPNEDERKFAFDDKDYLVEISR